MTHPDEPADEEHGPPQPLRCRPLSEADQPVLTAPGISPNPELPGERITPRISRAGMRADGERFRLA